MNIKSTLNNNIIRIPFGAKGIFLLLTIIRMFTCQGFFDIPQTRANIVNFIKIKNINRSK